MQFDGIITSRQMKLIRVGVDVSVTGSCLIAAINMKSNEMSAQVRKAEKPKNKSIKEKL